MLHAPPLAGSPQYGGDWRAVVDFVLRDAETLVAGGIDGLMLENFGDAPFFPGRVPAHVVASMTALAALVRARFDTPLGINVLRNDGQSALAIAHATGASLIRVNVLTGARVTDQGIVSGIAHDLLRERSNLHAGQIQILADVDVKHSAPLAARPLAEEVHDLLRRGGADGLIVTGRATGGEVALSEWQEIRAAAAASRLWIGSGVTPDTISKWAPHVDGFIVGTSLKVDGRVGNPVDVQRVRRLMQCLS
jgi:membrane complex biogenesis BtpA family protein